MIVIHMGATPDSVSEKVGATVLCAVCYRSFTPTGADSATLCPDCSVRIARVGPRGSARVAVAPRQRVHPPPRGVAAPERSRWFPAIGAAVASLVVGLLLWPERVLRHPPGMLVEEEPFQGEVRDGRPWNRDGYRITPLAVFRIRARVLCKKNYWFGRESDLSPCDLALGWRQMSDQVVLDQMKISQRRRWYWYQYTNPPVAQRTIETHSANMHIIPASDEVADRLGTVVRGHIVELSGYLVELTARDGWRWRSSLSRGDTGNGSCEVIWTEKLVIQN